MAKNIRKLVYAEESQNSKVKSKKTEFILDTKHCNNFKPRSQRSKVKNHT